LEPINYCTHWHDYERCHGHGSYKRLTDVERREQVHTWQNNNDLYDWGNVQLKLRKFKTTMEYVGVDFSNAYSTCGCCRLLSTCIGQCILRLVPKVLNVSGLLVGEEADLTFGSTSNIDLPRYTPQVLKAKYCLHFLHPDEMIKWETYQVEDEE
jgi:hypothetical protein